MAKNWKFNQKANSKQNISNIRCNHFKCKNYNTYEGCLIGRNFRNCELYHVHPSVNLILKSK